MKRRPTAARGLRARGLYHHGMAAALLLACMVLLGGAGLCAQDTSKIPTLKVWYEVQGVYDASYVENFDTDRGGKNALVLYRPRGESSTLYMRDRGDTVNMFTWGKWKTYDAGLWAGQVDFNGDGISDYLLDDGVVYQGRVKNGPPDSLPVAKYALNYWGIASRRVDDFNGDGKQDFITGTVSTSVQSSAPSGPIGKIILGNSDLTKMEVVDVPQIRGVTDDIQNIVGAWRENGKSYMVIYQYENAGYDPRTDLFILYEFSIDSARRVHYNPLDTTPFGIWPTSSRPYYNFSSSFVWHSRDGKEHTLVVFDVVNYHYLVFKIRDGKLVAAPPKFTGAGYVYYLPYSVGSIAEAGWCSETNALLFCNGDPFNGISYYAKVSAEGQQGVSSIGDVNNDGYGDVGVIYKTGTDNYRLVMYLGADFTTGVEDPSSSRLAMNISGEHPISSTKPLEVTLTVDKPGTYTIALYSLRGELISTLFSEQLPEGEHQRSLSLGPLATGLYNVRLSGGVHSVDKGLMIIP